MIYEDSGYINCEGFIYLFNLVYRPSAMKAMWTKIKHARNKH
jgi:hypothetical protein